MENGLSDYLARHKFDGTQAPSAGTPDDWTVFVNLSANMELNNAALRLDRDLQEQKLVDATRDRPVRFIVQTSLNTDPQLDGIGSHHNEPDASPMGPDQQHTAVVTYEIANGQKRLLSSGKSQGAETDLKTLLTIDPAALQSRHLMLINEAHGSGMKNLQTDAGELPPSSLSNVLSSTLAQHGRNGFDVLDLDGCEFGGAQLISELAGTTRYIVASEEPEYATWKSNENMQPLSEALSRLAANPQMNGVDAAKTILNATHDVCADKTKQRENTDGNKDHMMCGANTLAIYDMQAMDSVNQAMNGLGRALQAASELPGNADQIAKVMHSMPAVFASMVSTQDRRAYNAQHRDLGVFVEALGAGLQRGTIHDLPGGEVSQAVVAAKTALSELVVDNFNSVTVGPSMKGVMQDLGLPDQPLSGLATTLLQPQAGNAKQFAATLRAEISEAGSSQNRDYIAGEDQRLTQLTPWITNQETKEKLAQFIAAAERYRSFLSGQTSGQNADGRQEEQRWNSALQALVNDNRVMADLGMAKAVKQNHEIMDGEFVPSQADWNKFLHFMESRENLDIPSDSSKPRDPPT